jgi:hypothetical protein
VLLFEAREDEVVDRVADPGFIGDLRNGRALRRLEGPVVPVARFASGRGGPGEVLFDPLAQDGDVFGRELGFAHRHLQLAFVLDGLDEKAIVRRAGFDHGTEIAAFQDAFAAFKGQAAASIRSIVAGFAVIAEDGAYFACKERERLRRK